MDDFVETTVIHAAKRLGITNPEWMGDDWFTSHSPRNDNMNAEGMWCHWVHLARLILAHENTRKQMPFHYLEYNGPNIYDEHHPDCQRKEDG